jgi:hypothetical protein
MKSFSMRRRVICSLAAIAGLAMLAVSPAMASPITFAQYIQLGNGQQWTINTVGGTTTITAAGVDLFAFQSPTIFGATAYRTASFTFSASSSQPGDCDVATCLSGGYEQQGYHGSFSFIDTTLGTNLLSGTFNVTVNPLHTGGQLTSTIGGTGASFEGTTTVTNPIQLVLSSAYLDFSGAVLEDASFSLSSVIPNFGVDPQTIKPTGPFSAAGGGTFSYDNNVPEPATLSLIGGALLGLGMLRRKLLSRP